VAGNGGHDATFEVACRLVIGFDLCEDDALMLIREYNQRCEPPWSDTELRHKVAEAMKQPGERGGLAGESRERSAGGSSSSNSKQSHRYQPGDRVRALDRGNVGTVVSDDGGPTVEVHFDGTRLGNGKRTVAMPRDMIQPLGGTAGEPRPIELMPLADFDQRDFRSSYLVRGVLAAGQPCIVGGLSKTMKTSLLMDLAISLGTGTKFLGSFEVPKSVVVATLSGESGGSALQSTTRRICHSKGITPADASVFMGLTLPQLSNPEAIQQLRELIHQHEIRVLAIDPIYLCLIGGGSAISMGNIFDVGPLLMPLSEICMDLGTTIILCHHFRKNNPNGERWSPPELEELAQAGFAEFARQWLLIARRSKYEHDGNHRLWMVAGGSAGHSGCYAVDVVEGVRTDDCDERRWDVAVSSADDARQAAANDKAAAAEKRKKEQFDSVIERILDATRSPEHRVGVKEEIRLRSGANKLFGLAFDQLLQEGIFRVVSIKRNGRTVAAYERVFRDEETTL
jgi:replicative DNA helicase